MKRIILVLSSYAFLSLAWADPNLNEAAEGACECLKEPYEQAEKVMELISAAQQSGDMSVLVSAQGQMMGVVDASDVCFEALAQEYPEIDQSEELQEQVMEIADEQCPNPAGDFGS